MTEIIIEGVRADVYESIETKFTYQIDDIKSFGTRNTSFSKTIKLPATPKNKALFGFVERTDISNKYTPSQLNIGDNFNPAVTAKCIIICDYVQIFKGVIRILEVVTINDFTEYECSVFGELGGFMSAIANKYLTALDFSAYDTPWNAYSISASWNTISGTGVYFGLGNYGNVKIGSLDWDFKAFRPALYLREYLEKMATASGYTVDISDLTSITEFNKIVIPHNEDLVYIQTNIPLQRSNNANQIPAIYYLLPHSSDIVFQTANHMNSFTANSGNTEFTYTGTPTINGEFECGINYTCNGYSISAGYNPSFRIAIYKNGSVIGYSSSVFFDVVQFSGTINFNFQTTLSTSDVIKFRIELGVGSYIGMAQFFVNVKTGSYMGYITPQIISVPAIYNDQLSINNCIPKNIKQTDFFTSILKMLNCYVVEDKDVEKKIKITPYPDFYYPLQTANDWTNLVDRNSEIRIKPMSELNARFFDYLYDVDTDYLNELYKKKYGIGYGEFLLDTNYEFSKEKSECKIIFSGSPLFATTGEEKKQTIFFKSSDNGATETNQSTKIRLLLAKKITGVTSWHIKNGGNVGTYTVYGYMGHLDDPTTPTFDLNWNAPKELYYALSNAYPSSNLFSRYWLAYMSEIINKDSKLMTCNVYLDKQQIQELDFSIPIQVDGSIFKLNKVNDYDMNTDQTTKVELLKIV